jgi:uncharacterized protein (TIGR02246 family)
VHADERAIRQLLADWTAATVAGDLPALLELLADDVVFLTAGAPPMGKAAFAEAFAAILPQLRIEPQGEVQELVLSGDWAFAWTRLSVDATPREGGASLRRSGHTLTVFHREPDGRWRLSRDANLLVAEPSRPA